MSCNFEHKVNMMCRIYRHEYEMLCRGEIPTTSDGTSKADTDVPPRMKPSRKPIEQKQTKIPSIASSEGNNCKSAVIAPPMLGPGLTPGQIAREHFCEQEGLFHDSISSVARCTSNSCYDSDFDIEDIFEDDVHPEAPTAQTLTPATKVPPVGFYEVIPRDYVVRDYVVTTPIASYKVREDKTMFQKIR